MTNADFPEPTLAVFGPSVTFRFLDGRCVQAFSSENDRIVDLDPSLAELLPPPGVSEV